MVPSPCCAENDKALVLIRIVSRMMCFLSMLYVFLYLYYMLAL